MHAGDVMTTDVITVAPEASVQDLAALLANHGISGVPVVDSANDLVGIVSEGDLLQRTETGTERRTQRRRARWFDIFFASDRDAARDYVRSHGRTVRDLMTRDVITVTEAAELHEVADLLETKRVKRVPVVRDGKVIGIVSRANLVRALAAIKIPPAIDTDADDRAIRDKLLAELEGKEWVRSADLVVQDNVVHIWSFSDQPEEVRKALRVAAENMPGVRGVDMHILIPPMPLHPM